MGGMQSVAASQVVIEGIERATRILALFSSDVPEWTVTEVSRELGLPKTTVWDYMHSLTELGLLRRTARGRYRLGWRAFQLGLRARMTSDIAGPARAEMARLVEKFDETIQLVSRYRGEVVYLEKVSPKVGVHVNLTRVGERLPAHCTASGKVLLAHLPPSEVRSLYPHGELPGLTPNSIRSLDELEVDLARVRERGYSIDVEETAEGMCCVAAPVRNENGEVAWALSMSFLEYRIASNVDTYSRAMVEAAGRLSHPRRP